MTAPEAIASMREDLARLETRNKDAKNPLKPGFFRRREAEIDAVQEELDMAEGELKKAQGELADAVRLLDRMRNMFDRQVLWCRLFGIPDGLTHRFGQLVITGGRSLQELEAALAIRLERFAEQGPMPPLLCELRGRTLCLDPYTAQPWLDGDWSQREDAVNAALSAQAIDRSLERFAASLTPQQRATWERMCREVAEPKPQTA